MYLFIDEWKCLLQKNIREKFYKPFLMTKIIINKFKILLNAGFVKMV